MDGQMDLVLHVIDIGDGAIETTQVVIDCPFAIALVAFHLFDDIGRLIIIGDSLIEIVPSVGILSKDSQSLEASIQGIDFIRQLQGFLCVCI